MALGRLDIATVEKTIAESFRGAARAPMSADGQAVDFQVPVEHTPKQQNIPVHTLGQQ